MTKAKTSEDKTQAAADTQATTQSTPVNEQVAPNPTPADSSNPANSPAGGSDTAKGQGDTQATSDKIAESVQQAAAPILAVDSSAELKAKVNSVLGGVGATPQPTTVNGRDVTGKKLADDGESWVDDPDYTAPAGARAADIFDRIGDAVQHEPLRLVLEEIVHLIFGGNAEKAAKETLSLPEGMNNLKSTASLRTDITGYGAYAGSDVTGPGVADVKPDGTAAVTTADAGSTEK